MNFSRPYGTGVCLIAYPALKRRAIAMLSLRDSDGHCSFKAGIVQLDLVLVQRTQHPRRQQGTES